MRPLAYGKADVTRIFRLFINCLWKWTKVDCSKLWCGGHLNTRSLAAALSRGHIRLHRFDFPPGSRPIAMRATASSFDLDQVRGPVSCQLPCHRFPRKCHVARLFCTIFVNIRGCLCPQIRRVQKVAITEQQVKSALEEITDLSTGRDYVTS